MVQGVGDDGPEIRALDTVTTSALVGICLGATLFLLTVVGVTCFCYRRRVAYQHKITRKGPDKPLSLRRPTAVKNPQSGSHYLKKSPSPTGTKTPPGTVPGTATSLNGANPRNGSPIDCERRALVGKSTNNVGETCTPPLETKEGIKYHTENEKDKTVVHVVVGSPTKEEIELTEKLGEARVKLGKLFFKLRYKFEKSALVVTVVKCIDLPAKDSTLGSSDPYVKLQLLPDKQHRVKTRVLRKTLNPVYEEDFTFYGINYNQIQSITLHFVVLSFDRYSRDDIIGEVFTNLSSVDLSQAENQELALCRNIQHRSLKIRSQGRGELLVSLCWQPAANRLTVVVLKARNLPKMDVTGLADPYVKIYMLFNGQRISKKKTHVKKRTLNPVFNESFVFDVPAGSDGLANISLEFLLLDWDRVTKNEVIGRLELGGVKSTGSAQHHWNEVCNSPRRQIAEWHKLRE